MAIKSEAERRIENMTLGAMLILLGVEFLLDLPSGVFPLLAGVILLGSAFYQRSQGWDVSIFTWIFGGLFALVAVLDVLGVFIALTFKLWPLILIALGVMMLLNLRERR